MRLTLTLLALTAAHARNRSWFCYDAGHPDEAAPFAAVPTGFKLRHVQHVQRHGLRTPLSPMPSNNPTWTCGTSMLEAVSVSGAVSHETVSRVFRQEWIGFPRENNLPGNCTTGYLTVEGAQQLGSIGVGLRAYLGGFLGSDFDPAKAYVRSSDVPRTKQSAYALLNTLFPPAEDSRAADGAIPAIPIHTAEIDCDHSTGDDGTGGPMCPGISKLLDKIKQGPGWQHVLAGLAPLAPPFDAVYGSHWGSLRNFVGRGPDHLMMMECHGMEDQIPPSLNASYRAQLYALYDGWWSTTEMTYEMGLIQIGRFLQQLAGYMDRAATTGDGYVFRMFMAHEHSIAYSHSIA
jgi:hypothetical protein